MSLTQSDVTLLNRTSDVTKILDNMYTELCQIDALYAGSPNYAAHYAQENINLIPEYLGAGLLTAHIAGAEYALATLKSTIESQMVALAMIASIPRVSVT